MIPRPSELAIAAEAGETRTDKLAVLAALGVPAYSATSERTALVSDLGTQVEGTLVTLCGRASAIRRHGAVLFIDLVDRSGCGQLVCDRGELGVALETLRRWLSVGDIVEARGRIGRTKRGQPSLFVRSVRPLAKCCQPVEPATDPEHRFRSRARDLIANSEARDTMLARAAVFAAARSCLTRRGFLEFQTPVLQPRYGGGKSRPFRTHAHALDRPMFLRVTSEIYLKQMVAGGFERVYEIGPCFRNEGITPGLSQEFSMLEAYHAYAGLSEMKQFVVDLVQAAAEAVARAAPALAPRTEALRRSWQTLSYREAFERYVGRCWRDHEDRPSVLAALGANASNFARCPDNGTLHQKILEKLISPHFDRPTFVSGLPVCTSPLMQRSARDPGELERAWFFARGVFLCDIACELNDPHEQARRLTRQRGDLASVHDYDNTDPGLIEALMTGLPPLAGVGLGVDRLVMVVLGQPSIREVIPFPFVSLRA